MCIEEDTIFVTAVDVDQFPNAGPYEFTVIEKESQGKWTVEHFNGKISFEFVEEFLDNYA